METLTQMLTRVIWHPEASSQLLQGQWREGGTAWRPSAQEAEACQTQEFHQHLVTLKPHFTKVFINSQPQIGLREMHLEPGVNSVHPQDTLPGASLARLH